jgi:hypothetical protein
VFRVVLCRGQVGEGGGRNAHRHGARARGAGGRSPGETDRSSPGFSGFGSGKWVLIPRSGLRFAGEKAVRHGSYRQPLWYQGEMADVHYPSAFCCVFTLFRARVPPSCYLQNVC